MNWGFVNFYNNMRFSGGLAPRGSVRLYFCIPPPAEKSRKRLRSTPGDVRTSASPVVARVRLRRTRRGLFARHTGYRLVTSRSRAPRSRGSPRDSINAVGTRTVFRGRRGANRLVARTIAPKAENINRRVSCSRAWRVVIPSACKSRPDAWREMSPWLSSLSINRICFDGCRTLTTSTTGRRPEWRVSLRRAKHKHAPRATVGRAIRKNSDHTRRVRLLRRGGDGGGGVRRKDVGKF